MTEEKIPCEHEWVYLRSEERESYSKRVDIFYCKKCCEYFEKVVWQGRKF